MGAKSSMQAVIAFRRFRPEQFFGTLTRIVVVLTFHIPKRIELASILTGGVTETGPTLLRILHRGVGPEALNFRVYESGDDVHTVRG